MFDPILKWLWQLILWKISSRSCSDGCVCKVYQQNRDVWICETLFSLIASCVIIQLCLVKYESCRYVWLFVNVYQLLILYIEEKLHDPTWHVANNQVWATMLYWKYFKRATNMMVNMLQHINFLRIRNLHLIRRSVYHCNVLFDSSFEFCKNWAPGITVYLHVRLV